MWSDNETEEDLLGYQVHADLLKKIILNDAMLPISIGGIWELGVWQKQFDAIASTVIERMGGISTKRT